MLNILWFIIWGLLWAMYFALDGFDLGIGMLFPFFGKTDQDKKTMLESVGPVWDANEVWLITAGGATFAAFPTTYAYMFSFLYLPLMLILYGLIIRAVCLEFRYKVNNPSLASLLENGLFLGSLLPALLLGVAFGNIFQGLPIDQTGYHGNLITLLNPFGLITGILFVVAFLLHGSLWLSFRTEGDINLRAKALARKLWFITLFFAVLFLVSAYFVTNLYANYFSMPFLLIVPILCVIGLLGAGFFINSSEIMAFLSSAICIIFLTFTGVGGLYPNLIPSSINNAFSLSAFNSSSSQYTLTVMTVVVIIFVPIVLAYKFWTYKTFSYKIKEGEGEGY
ncbi:cytochrome d ubiquinol oxidase subunit II [Thermodesulfobium sp. 4217-1]|uniref:cytochrome d ubiquinol oxidase subunit II n=1 Tax=Thermodesulfobium sp. 4217-1 TaxID=3120013 RepID=UPI0032217F7D